MIQNGKRVPGKSQKHEKVGPSYNPYNISRNINSKIKREVLNQLRYDSSLRMVESSLHRPNVRATDPLLLLKLHAQLSKIKDHFDHLPVYRKLTKRATDYIEYELQKGAANHLDIKDILYIGKFSAYKMLILYLRETKRPDRVMIEQYIQLGIYGYSKNKFSSRVKGKIERWMKLY